MKRDRGRSRVYKVEEAVFAGSEASRLRSFDEVVEVAEAVFDTRWWSRFDVEVELRQTRPSARSSFCDFYGGRSFTVAMCPAQLEAATLAHELAHVITSVSDVGDPGHGPTFRSAMVDLTAVILGHRWSDTLLDALHDAGLDIGQRKWWAPGRSELVVARRTGRLEMAAA